MPAVELHVCCAGLCHCEIAAMQQTAATLPRTCSVLTVGQFPDSSHLQVEILTQRRGVAGIYKLHLLQCLWLNKWRHALPQAPAHAY